MKKTRSVLCSESPILWETHRSEKSNEKSKRKKFFGLIEWANTNIWTNGLLWRMKVKTIARWFQEFLGFLPTLSLSNSQVHFWFLWRNLGSVLSLRKQNSNQFFWKSDNHSNINNNQLLIERTENIRGRWYNKRKEERREIVVIWVKKNMKVTVRKFHAIEWLHNDDTWSHTFVPIFYEDIPKNFLHSLWNINCEVVL
jgi:hypothetical protein